MSFVNELTIDFEDIQGAEEVQPITINAPKVEEAKRGDFNQLALMCFQFGAEGKSEIYTQQEVSAFIQEGYIMVTCTIALKEATDNETRALYDRIEKNYLSVKKVIYKILENNFFANNKCLKEIFENKDVDYDLYTEIFDKIISCFLSLISTRFVLRQSIIIHKMNSKSLGKISNQTQG